MIQQSKHLVKPLSGHIVADPDVVGEIKVAIAAGVAPVTAGAVRGAIAEAAGDTPTSTTRLKLRDPELFGIRFVAVEFIHDGPERLGFGGVCTVHEWATSANLAAGRLTC